MTNSKVYTRTGDKGETSLVSGTRLSKGSARLDLYGEVDHLNSYIGLLVSELANNGQNHFIQKILNYVQNKLFDMGSLLACESEHHMNYHLNLISSNDVQMLENAIDDMDQSLPRLSSFILPGGCRSGAMAHICRTTCRTIERKMVNFSMENENQISKEIMMFINRLSDYFFVLARYLNDSEGVVEVKWQKK